MTPAEPSQAATDDFPDNLLWFMSDLQFLKIFIRPWFISLHDFRSSKFFGIIFFDKAKNGRDDSSLVKCWQRTPLIKNTRLHFFCVCVFPHSYFFNIEDNVFLKEIFIVDNSLILFKLKKCFRKINTKIHDLLFLFFFCRRLPKLLKDCHYKLRA